MAIGQRIIKNNNNIALAPWPVAAILTIAVFIFFYCFYYNHLLYREQNLLFIYKSEYLLGYIGKIGWIANILGDFFSQFLIYRFLGSFILAFWIVAFWTLSFFAFKRCHLSANWSMTLATLLALWEWLRETDLNYPLSATIALVGGVSLFFVFALMHNQYMRILVGLALLAFAYWCFADGIWVLVFFIIVKLAKEAHWALALCLVVVCCLIPINYFSLSTNLAYWPNLNEEQELSKYNNRIDVNDFFDTSLSSDAIIPKITSTTNILNIDKTADKWYRLGDMDKAEKLTLLAMGKSKDSRGIKYVKRLAKIAIVNDDSALLDKYLNLLNQTLFYSSWAQDIKNGDLEDSLQSEICKLRKYKCQNDTLRFVNDIAPSLRRLVECNVSNTKAYECLIFYDLQNRDLKAFEKDYVRGSLNNRVVDEAVLLSMILRKCSIEEIKQAGVSPDLIDDYNDYVELVKTPGHKQEDVMLRYGNSYWHYYFQS